MGKWTNEGFVANTLEYYKLAIQRLFVEAFGDDFLLDDSLPQGILIQRLAELFYNADMDGIEAFSRLNPNAASGIYLDILGRLRGYVRNKGTPQVATVQLTVSSTGFQPFTIPEGVVFTTTNGGVRFITSSPQLVSSTSASIYLDYTESGNSSASINDTLYAEGYSQITNMVITYLADGTEDETDLEYRSRILTTFPVASNTLESVRQLLLASPYVKTVGVNYNDTDTLTDSLPPYSTEWLVVPKSGTGDPAAYLQVFKEAVGTIIINNKTPGAATAGNTTVQVADVFGTPKDVNFTIPTAVPVEISVTVATPEATGVLDLSRTDAERQVITDYIDGLAIGSNVSFSRCMAPLTGDIGYNVTEMKIRRDGAENWNINTDLNIGNREYATISLSNITIGV